MKLPTKMNLDYKKLAIVNYFFFVVILAIAYYFGPTQRISINPPKTELSGCDLILRYEAGLGLGVYAGRLYEPEEVVHDSVAIPVPIEAFDETNEDVILSNYIEGHNGTHYMADLGYAMIFNHAPISEGKMFEKYAIDDNRYGDELKESNYVSNWMIFPGDQVFSNYGDDWFSARGLNEVFPRKHPNKNILRVDDLENDPGRIPGCSYAFVDTVFNNNKLHLHAKANISRGTIIEVTRALLLPEERMRFSGPLRPFLWSSPAVMNIEPTEAPEGSRYAVLVLGKGALFQAVDNYNHDSSGNTSSFQPNVAYDWWDISFLGLAEEDTDPCAFATRLIEEKKEIGDIHPCAKSALEERRFPHNNRSCRKAEYISFTALRDINMGEELLIDLKTDHKTGRRFTKEYFSQFCL